MAASAGFRARQPRQVGQQAARLVAEVRRPAGLVVFVGGSLATLLDDVARAVAESCPGIPAVVASGAWVLHRDGELEGDSAAAVLVYGGKPATVFATRTDGEGLGVELRDTLERLTVDSAPAVFLLCDPARFDPGELAPLASLALAPRVFGAGTIGSPGIAAISAEGAITTGPCAALVFHGLTAPIIEVSPACKILSPYHEITAHDGGMVLRLDDEPALDVLSRAGEQLDQQVQLFAALAEDPDASALRPRVLLRPIRGVDPVRRGLFIGEPPDAGARMAIAARDADGARADLEAMVQRVRQRTAGAALRFGLYVNCAGRGSALYNAFDVDSRILRTALPGMPLIGMSSAFELAPHADRPRLHLHTGVLAVFTAPS